MAASRGGGQILLLLGVLGALCAAGGFNYYRNLTAEQEEMRPFASYPVEALEQLRSATEAEVAKLDRSYAARRDARPTARDHALLGDQAREFERVQAASRGERVAGQQLSVREAELADIEIELARRARPPWEVHLERLTTL